MSWNTFWFLLKLFNTFWRSYKNSRKSSNKRYVYICFAENWPIKRNLKKYNELYIEFSLSKAPLFFLFGKSSIILIMDTLCDVILLYSTLMNSSTASSEPTTRSDSFVEILLLNFITMPLSTTFSSIRFFFLLD